MNKQEKLLLINEVFTPSSPVERNDFFIGRQKAIEEIRTVVSEKGLHAAVIGARGVGKTSLMNMLRYMFENLLIIKVNCNRNDTFNSIWERALRKIRFISPAAELGFKGTEKIEIVPINVPQQLLLNATEIENILTDLNQNSLFVFDEFDNVKRSETKNQLADLLKMLSDTLPNVTVLIAGHAQSIDKLIGEHSSLERCVKQISLQLFEHNEAMDLVENSLNLIGMKAEKDVVNNIVRIASGFPNYLHLITKNSAIEAVQGNSDIIAKYHFENSLVKSIENSHYTIKNAYNKVISDVPENRLFEDLLYACVLARKDNENAFGIDEVVHQLKKIKGKDISSDFILNGLAMLCKREKSEILTKLGRQKNARYTFKKPQIMAYVNLKQYQIYKN